MRVWKVLYTLLMQCSQLDAAETSKESQPYVFTAPLPFQVPVRTNYTFSELEDDDSLYAEPKVRFVGGRHLQWKLVVCPANAGSPASIITCLVSSHIHSALQTR